MGNTISNNATGYQKYVIMLSTIFPIAAVYDLCCFNRYKNLYSRISNLENIVYTDNYYDDLSCNDILDISYYTLYIYIDCPEHPELKELYLNAANKHNYNVDRYLDAVNNNFLDETNINDYCYDSGFDLYCPENVKITNKDMTYMLDHKIKCAMKYSNSDTDYGFCGYYLYSRSSTPIKTPLRMANSVGIIDSGYRGSIKAYFDNRLYNNNNSSYFTSNGNEQELSYNLEFGNRFVQICAPDLAMMRIKIVDNENELGYTLRGSNGFGSTGN